jgi:hypothetical protein
MKAKNIKRILAIVVVCLVLALTVTTIILAVVPYNVYNPIKDDFVRVTVYRDEISNSFNNGDLGTDEHNKVIDELLALNEKSLKDNLLSSMFQGVTSYEVEVTNTAYSTIKNLYDGEGIFCLVFDYLDNVQTLKIDDEEFKFEETFSAKSIEYTKVIMPITNTEDFQNNTLYFVKDGKSNYQLKYLAHQSELYDYIKNMEMSQIKAQ